MKTTWSPAVLASVVKLAVLWGTEQPGVQVVRKCPPLAVNRVRRIFHAKPTSVTMAQTRAITGRYSTNVVNSLPFDTTRGTNS